MLEIRDLHEKALHSIVWCILIPMTKCKLIKIDQMDPLMRCRFLSHLIANGKFCSVQADAEKILEFVIVKLKIQTYLVQVKARFSNFNGQITIIRSLNTPASRNGIVVGHVLLNYSAITDMIQLQVYNSQAQSEAIPAMVSFLQSISNHIDTGRKDNATATLSIILN